MSGAVAAFEAAPGRASEEGRWIVYGEGRFAVHLLLLRGADPRRLSAVTPFDTDTPARLVMAAREWRILRGQPLTADDQLTAQRRRLTLALRAHDARTQGASHRDIAVAFFVADRVDTARWKTTSLREATLRLVREARTLTSGGHNALLRPRRLSR